MAVASYPFEPREAGEVGFAVGDLIEVIEQDDSGWWVGVANGKVYPSHHFEFLSPFHLSPLFLLCKAWAVSFKLC